MLKCIGSAVFGCLFAAAPLAHAATIVDFGGNSTGSLATGSLSITLTDGAITGSITNTAPFDARITGFGFDIGSGNINGFTGSIAPAGSAFTFTDSNLGNVPQFSDANLDFGAVTGNNFAGGQPNQGLDNAQTLNFVINGSFAGLSESEIASAIFVRFQRVGADGEGSDVAFVDDLAPLPSVPEPASMLLMGSGLALLARRRMRRA